MPNFHSKNSAAFRLIFYAEIWQCFTLMCHSTSNAILTKLWTCEYDNGDAPFSRRKSSRVLGLRNYGTPAGFLICVYGVYWHARTVTSRSPLKHQACWCVSHTRGNQCHLVTWIETITPRWSCTQYSMNMHLRQLPWVYTHITRSRALMTRKGHSRSHESPSYKVHNHPYTSRYRYTYNMYNLTTQSEKVNQTLPTFQGYGPTRYRKCKTDIAIPREHCPSKE